MSVRKHGLADQLTLLLHDQITSGVRGAGSRLPTEDQLAREFDVSRSVVREAMARLKADGLVVTRQGYGAKVASSLSDAPFRFSGVVVDSREEVTWIFELRLAVESEAAALAAERATRAQRTAMKKALLRSNEATASGEDGVLEDFAFHRAVVHGANNPRYDDFVAFLSRRIVDQAIVSRRNSTLSNRIALLKEEHAAILDAILGRDPEAARAAARRHFTNGIRRFAGFGAH